MIKKIVKSVVGRSNLGRLDFLRRNRYMQHGWGGPFNGQRFRQLIFFDLLYHFPIKAIVETGTLRGTTTALFVATSLPVYTVEINPRHFYYAKMRFLFNRDTIHLYKNDSRSFLQGLCEDSSVPKKDVFFYLDSHWEGDLPLRDELKIIFSKWENPIVMVDDFRVPNSHYRFDNYGPGKTLDLCYIDPVVADHNISVFFPAANWSEETGARRGSVVLCNDISGAELNTKVKTLVQDPSYS